MKKLMKEVLTVICSVILAVSLCYMLWDLKQDIKRVAKGTMADSNWQNAEIAGLKKKIYELQDENIELRGMIGVQKWYNDDAEVNEYQKEKELKVSNRKPELPGVKAPDIKSRTFEDHAGIYEIVVPNAYGSSDTIGTFVISHNGECMGFEDLDCVVQEKHERLLVLARKNIVDGSPIEIMGIMGAVSDTVVIRYTHDSDTDVPMAGDFVQQ